MTKISTITAAILAGGLGTRLRSVVADRPKVIADVSGRPFLAYLLEQVASAGIRNVVLCTGYMAGRIQECFGSTYGPLRITYSTEHEPLGTGGALRLALPYLESETVLVMNGDSYMDVDLRSFVNWFFQRQRQAALVLTEVDDTSRYGRVRIDPDGSIISFEEKCDNSGPGWINAGVYLIEKSVLTRIPQGRFYSLEKDFFPQLVGGGLFGFCAEGRFIDIGTPQSYAVAEEFFGRGF